jgi:hypothetical protein
MIFMLLNLLPLNSVPSLGKRKKITRAQIRRQRGCGTTGILCFARYSNANKVV